MNKRDKNELNIFKISNRSEYKKLNRSRACSVQNKDIFWPFSNERNKIGKLLPLYINQQYHVNKNFENKKQ